LRVSFSKIIFFNLLCHASSSFIFPTLSHCDRYQVITSDNIKALFGAEFRQPKHPANVSFITLRVVPADIISSVVGVEVEPTKGFQCPQVVTHSSPNSSAERKANDRMKNTTKMKMIKPRTIFIPSPPLLAMAMASSI